MRPQSDVIERDFVTAEQRESRQLQKKAFLWSLAIFALSNITNFVLNPSYRNVFAMEKNGFLEAIIPLASFVGAYFVIKVVAPKTVMQKINNTPSIWMKIFLGSAILVFFVYLTRFLTGGL
jgi:hypothetical protein